MDIKLVILLALLLLNLLYRRLEKFYLESLEIKDLDIPATVFVKHILSLIETDLPCIKPYNVDLKYYNTKSVLGRYYFYSNTLVIYLCKSSKLIEVTDTVIHEYCHHLQNHLKRNEIKKALELYNEAYENHPWEVQARNLAEIKRLTILKKLTS